MLGIEHFAFAVDSRENWIQYPPRNQIVSKESLLPEERKVQPSTKNKDIVPGVKSNWEKNPPVDPKTIVISKQISYDGAKEKITTTYEDQSTKTVIFPAIDESFIWGANHISKIITYEFADGSKHEETVEVPAIVQPSVYDDDIQIVKISFADGFEKIVRKRPKSESYTWESDHVTKRVTYYYSNGERHSIKKVVPPILGKPIYEAEIEIFTARYWDGEVGTKSIKAIDTKISWASDHVTKTIDYAFPDGTHNIVRVNEEGVASKPTYENGLEKITITYGDGYEETNEFKAQAEEITWSSDHLKRTITYLFKDGTNNPVVSMVDPEVADPVYQDGKKIIVTTFGDGFKQSKSIKSLTQNEILSNTRSSKKVNYLYEDGTTHTDAFILNDDDAWVYKKATVTTKDKSEPVIRIKKIELIGNKLFTDKELLHELQGWLGQDADFSSIKNTALVISDYYKDAGWLARAELPPQDVTDGVIKIKITEAKFAGAKVVSSAKPTLNEKLPIGTIEKNQKIGDPVNLNTLEQSSILVSEIPGIQANISLNPGKEVATTELDIKLEKSKLLDTSATLDNFGAVSTGSNRFSTQTSLNGPLQRGDLWNLQTLQSAGLQYLRGSYSENVGFSGIRIGAYASNMEYQLITPEYMGLNALGPSNDRGLEFSDPLIRNKNTNLTLQTTLDQKHFNNITISGTTSNYSAKILTNSLVGSKSDDWLKGGTTSATLQVTFGNMNLDGSPNQYSDSITTNTQGNYAKTKVTLSRQQKLSSTTTLIGTYQTQLASKNLDGSEMIYLGGIQGIRAYPTNEAGGSIGQILNLEVQNQVPINNGSMIVAPFLDIGEITVNKFNSYIHAVTENNYGLSGAGFWLGYNNQDSLGFYNFKFIFSRRIGPNPGQNANGLDQNGTYILNRFWLSANQSF